MWIFCWEVVGVGVGVGMLRVVLIRERVFIEGTVRVHLLASV